MKINTDVAQVIPGRFSANSYSIHSKNKELFNNAAQKSENAYNQNLIQSIIEKQSSEKQLTDALSIAQMAQGVMQKALEISSRLNNIAMDAMVSKKINQNELDTVNSMIKSSFKEYTDRFDIAFIPIPTQAEKTGEIKPKTMNFDIKNEMAALKDISSEMNSGRIPSRENIESLSKQLGQKSAALNDAINSITDRGTELLRGYNADLTQPSAQKLVADTGSYLLNNYSAGLFSQGNVARENVNSLLRE